VSAPLSQGQGPQGDELDTAIAAAEGEEVPRPRASVALMVLATLAVGFTLWAMQEVALPILLALFFALVGNPIIRLFGKLRVPRSLAAVLVVAGGLLLAFALGRQLVAPATEWVSELPQQMARLQPKLRSLAKPVQDANRVAENIARAAGGDAAPKSVPVVRTADSTSAFKPLTATPKILAQVLAVILLTLFFMIFGQDLQRHAIDLLPSWRKKRLTVDILQSIEREMSRYVLTISVINVVLGLVIAASLHVGAGIDWQDALLWGTMATILNYAPYAGPLIGVIVMLVMGFVTRPPVWPALVPAAIYLGLHTLEGQIITPIVLGRRMALSPLLLMLALMVFGWMWGIIGLLLAVPLLVCAKIVLSKVEGMDGWARLLE